MTILGDVARKDGAPELRVRTRMVYVILIIAFLGIISRLAVLQIAHGERFTYLSENNRVRIKRVPGTRGMIMDRQGELMVEADHHSTFCLSPKMRKTRKTHCGN